MQKNLLLGLLLFTYSINYCDSPLLVVVLMVKNEQDAVVKTLKPFAQNGVDSFFVFDTGSTDKTVEFTQQFFAQHNIKHGIIAQEPFIDFANSRNRALELAQQQFPDAAFMIMPDAEWYMQNVPELLTFCHEKKDDTEKAYLVRILIEDSLDFYTARLIRCKAGAIFKGAVHEALDYYAKIKAPKDSYFLMKSTRYGIEKSRKRWVRDCQLLRKEYDKNPQDPRTVFYLAQTYACLGDWPHAIEWYHKRKDMWGWDEENFINQYKMAQAYEASNDWHNALIQYVESFSMRPTRIEPLVKLANYYWENGNKELCFLFAQRACQMPYPETDLLFVEKEMYDFTRYDLLGRSAWYVGEYDLGENAIKKALEKHPEREYLKFNLECYANKSKK